MLEQLFSGPKMTKHEIGVLQNFLPNMPKGIVTG